MKLFKVFDQWINYKNFGIITYILSLLFSFLLDIKQYRYLEQQQLKVFDEDPKFKEFCSVDMTLENCDSYPMCPIETKTKLFKLQFSKITQLCGVYHMVVSHLVYLVTYSTGLYPILRKIFVEFYETDDLISFGCFRLACNLSSIVPVIPVVCYVYSTIQPKYVETSSKNYSSPIGMVIFLLSSIILGTFLEVTLSSAVMSFQYSSLFEIASTIGCITIFNNIRSYFQFKSLIVYTQLPQTKYLESFGPMVDKMGFAKEKVLIVTNSEQISQMRINACVIGSFGLYSMIIFDGIIELMTIPELKGVVCHELGHWLYAHMNSRILIVFVQNCAMLYFATGFIRNVRRSYDFKVPNKCKLERKRSYGGEFHADNSAYAIGEFLFVFGFFGHFVSIFNAVHCQSQELQSDAVSVEFGLGNELKEGLKKLYATSEHPSIDPFVNWCLSTHPTLEERHQHIDKTMAVAEAKRQEMTKGSHVRPKKSTKALKSKKYLDKSALTKKKTVRASRTI